MANDVRDVTGHVARVFPVMGPNSLTIFTDKERKLVEALFGAGRHFFKEETNPYPAAGSIGKEQPFNGNVPRVPYDAPATH